MSLTQSTRNACILKSISQQSDICTCRPYLLHGIEEAIKCSQKGGVGLIVYFQKEGRALGEVTKYLVYNARKRGVDTASQYFQRTENIVSIKRLSLRAKLIDVRQAGVKDMRFQAFMPDVLHWLGVKKVRRHTYIDAFMLTVYVTDSRSVLDERYEIRRHHIVGHRSSQSP